MLAYRIKLIRSSLMQRYIAKSYFRVHCTQRPGQGDKSEMLQSLRRHTTSNCVASYRRLISSIVGHPMLFMISWSSRSLVGHIVCTSTVESDHHANS